MEGAYRSCKEMQTGKRNYLKLNWFHTAHNGSREIPRYSFTVTILPIKKYIYILFFLSYFFFFFTILYWFCHTSAWICHGCTHVPHPEPPSHSLPVPSFWVIPVHQPQASCNLNRTWTGDSFLIWYYTWFNAILPNHPTLFLSYRVQKTVLYICVSFAVLHTGLSLPSF